MKKRTGYWAWVTCAGGPEVIAWIDPRDRKVDGWVVPWFPDVSLSVRIAAYFEGEEPERLPSQEVSGRWTFHDGEDLVELPRVRRRVVAAGKMRMMALSDSAPLKWCWEEEGLATESDVAHVLGLIP